MIRLGTALSVGQYLWHNRRGIMRAYHKYFVPHKVVLDEILDLADEHPKSPVNQKKEVR